MTDRGVGGAAVPFREVFAVREFRVLWLAQLLSVLGDQLSRVAVSVLVFDRTGSEALTAVTFALTFLPDLVAGPLLSGLADRYPRRAVMLAADAARAVLVPAMAVPSAPLELVFAILVLAQVFAAPHRAARSATLAAALVGPRYAVGLAASNATNQAAQFAGFALGGVLVAVVGVSVTLLVDAATFVLSAVLVAVGVRIRPAPSPVQGRPGWWSGMRIGVRLVVTDRRLRALIGLASLSGCYVAVEGVAVPYARSVGGGPVAAGLLLAAAPVGTALGMLVLARLVAPAAQQRLMGPLATAASVPLVVCAARPPLSVAIVLFALSGVAAAYQLTANAAFVQAVPDERRGQAFGLATMVLQVAQGVGIGIAGLLAEVVDPAGAVASAGVVGILAALPAGRAWRRASAAHSPGATRADPSSRAARGSPDSAPSQ